MLKNTLKIIIVVYSLTIPLIFAQSVSFKNIIVFGDSLSDAGSFILHDDDQGNNFWVKTSGKKGAPIVNQDEKTGLHPLWINFLVAQIISDNPIIYPVRKSQLLHLNPLADNLSYAWAGAETNFHYLNNAVTDVPYPLYNDQHCDVTGPGLISPEEACTPGVLRQVALYLQAVNNKPNSRTLFIIWAGGNDIFYNINKLIHHQAPC